MPVNLVQVRIPSDSAVPEDVVINAWTISMTANDSATADAVAAALDTFYTALSGFLSSTLTPTGWEVRFYNRADPEPRAPWATRTFDIAATDTNTFPREVALCLSFQAVPVSGIPQARRRGRIYLGPFGSGVGESATGRPSSSLRTAVLNAADAFLTASQVPDGWSWDVWSTVTGSAATVANGWVDNEWDTQRRRGLRATTRQVFN